MIRRTVLLVVAAALFAAPASGQGVVTVSTAEQPATGAPRFCGGACSGIVQYIRTPMNALRVLSFKLYVTARNMLTGDPAPIPDYAIGFARVPNWDPVRGNYVDGWCECFYGALGKYSWADGYFNDNLSALGQFGEGWLVGQGAYKPSYGNQFLPFTSDQLVGGEWLAFWVYAYAPDVAVAGVPVGNAIEGWNNIDWGGASAEMATTGVDLRFEAKFVTVPEPSPLVMLLPGLLMVALLGWRRAPSAPREPSRFRSIQMSGRATCAVLILLALSAWGASAQANPQTIGTSGAPQTGSWSQSTNNGIVGQTLRAPPGGQYLTGFRFLIGRSVPMTPSSASDWSYLLSVKAIPSYWDGTAVGMRDPLNGDWTAFGSVIYQSPWLSAPLSNTPAWIGVGGLNLPVTPLHHYAIYLTFTTLADHASLSLAGPLVSDAAYSGGLSFYCGPCFSLGQGDMVFEADFISVPEPRAFVMVLPGLLMLFAVEWRRRVGASPR